LDDSEVVPLIHVRQWGLKGPEVILVHGHVVSSRYMAPLGQLLGRRFRVYAPDLPGYGNSPKPPRTLTIRELADELGAFASRFDKPILIGNSMGCQVMIDLVARTDLASRIVLIGPTIDSEARSVLRQATRVGADALYEQRLPGLATIYLSDLWKAGVPAMWAALQHALDDRPEQKAPLIAVPALVVRGSKDTVAPHGWAERLATLMPQGRLMTVPRAGHGLHYSASQRLVDAILPFLLGDDNRESTRTPSQRAPFPS
jgi:pimeloyl-ACP methyl ester carboxylesterase